MARSRRTAVKKSVKLDLRNVETRASVPTGDYPLAVAAVTQKEGNVADFLEWRFKVTGGDHEGDVLVHNTSLAPQSLWALKSLLEALGVEIPDSAFQLEFSELEDLEVMGAVELGTNNDGKRQSNLIDFWSIEADGEPEEEDEEDDEEEKPKRRRRASKADDDDEDEKPTRRRRRAKKAEPEEDEEDDDEEEDEKPKRGRRAKAEAKPKRSRRGKKEEPEDEPELTQQDVQDMSQEELSDLIEQHELDVDLGDYKTLRKMKTAVIDALDEAGVLAD